THRPRHHGEFGAELLLVSRRKQRHCGFSFEEIVERLAGAGRAYRACLPFNGCSGLEERAQVPLIFRRDTCSQRLLGAFPSSDRIERAAVDTAVHVDAAPRASSVRLDGNCKPIPAARTPKYFMRPHQVRGARTSRVLQGPAGRMWRRRRFLAAWLAIPWLVL